MNNPLFRRYEQGETILNEEFEAMRSATDDELKAVFRDLTH
jgi:hypothetical protein